MLVSNVLLFAVLVSYECVPVHSVQHWGLDDDLMLNEVFLPDEKSDSNGKVPLPNGVVESISVRDVKCLLSDSSYHCTEKMDRIKGILIKVVEDDCHRCTTEEKREAGIAILSLLVDNRAALKSFLIKHKGFEKVQALAT